LRRTLVAAALAWLSASGSTGAARAADTARLHGTVVDPHGRGVGGFPLRVRDDAGRDFELRTARNGTFSAVGLAPGKIVVTLEGASYQRSRAVCRLDADASGVLRFLALRGNGYVTEPCRIEPPTTDEYIVK